MHFFISYCCRTYSLCSLIKIFFLLLVRRVVFDNLDKAFCILRLDSAELYPTNPDSDDELSLPADLIRRVDLIVSPPEEYPFALVSWTGSKVSGHGHSLSLVYSSESSCCIGIDSEVSIQER